VIFQEGISLDKDLEMLSCKVRRAWMIRFPPCSRIVSSSGLSKKNSLQGTFPRRENTGPPVLATGFLSLFWISEGYQNDKVVRAVRTLPFVWPPQRPRVPNGGLFRAYACAILKGGVP